MAFAFAALPTHAETAIPALAARVTDLTGTLTAPQRSSLESELAEFERRKGAQIAVLIVPTTMPETIEAYSLRVVESWKLGRQRVDDGVLLLVAKDDHKLRIEAGYGLEGVIPDAIAKRIIDEIIVPFFKRGDFYGGIEAGVNQLLRLIDGEPLPAPQARDPSWTRAFDLIPFLFIAVLVGGAILRALFGHLLGASIVGGVVGVIAWFMLGSLLIAAVVALIAFVFGLLNGTSSGRHGYGGWTNTGGGGGFSGGDSGGFSGGGGGFGGGGASGSW